MFNEIKDFSSFLDVSFSHVLSSVNSFADGPACQDILG